MREFPRLVEEPDADNDWELDELFWDEGTLDDLPGRSYLIDGLLGWNELTLAWGAPKDAGKTAFWLRACRRVSQGLPIFGRAVRQASAQPQRTLYIALENPSDIRDRCDALYEIDGPANDFGLIIDQIPLLDERFCRRLAARISRDNIVMVVIDTLKRALGGFDENQGGAVGTLFANLAILRGTQTGRGNTAVVGLHHGTKNGMGGPRGHGDFFAAPDTLIHHTLLKDGSRQAKVVAARADPPGLTLRYRINPYRLPEPNARTTPTVEEIIERRGRPRRSYAGIALDRLRHAVVLAGSPIRVEAWRDGFYAEVSDLTPENRRQQFNRAKSELVTGQRVTLADGLAAPSVTVTK